MSAHGGKARHAMHNACHEQQTRRGCRVAAQPRDASPCKRALPQARRCCRAAAAASAAATAALLKQERRCCSHLPNSAVTATLSLQSRRRCSHTHPYSQRAAVAAA